eukprot:TRINITY_DN26412_c0_g1_i1.p1 TRINITY_DN26412_c0_g1~~TRINITY_DN26412_c0_g1_i1.p1  ORF type:complete len:284 (-),score=33.94 TRINITY_DN26412_c0_g1_i1:182-964(-)
MAVESVLSAQLSLEMSMPSNSLSRLTEDSIGNLLCTNSRASAQRRGSQEADARLLGGVMVLKDWLAAPNGSCARRNTYRADAMRLRRAVLARVGIECSQTAAPEDSARVFLCEEATRQYLSVTQSGETTLQHSLLSQLGKGAICSMTEKPVSLFVCHRGADASGAATVDFEHEGLPACGSFLSARGSWGEALSFTQAGSSERLLCERRSSNPGKEFMWHPNSTIQHVSTGLWLYMDPADPGLVTLHASKKSVWEALPATS